VPSSTIRITVAEYCSGSPAGFTPPSPSPGWVRLRHPLLNIIDIANAMSVAAPPDLNRTSIAL
jgi:hypothetical protein